VAVREALRDPLLELPLDLVHRQVDRRVEVGGRLLGGDVQLLAAERDLGDVAPLADFEDDVRLDGTAHQLVDALHLGLGITAQGRRGVHVTEGDQNLHLAALGAGAARAQAPPFRIPGAAWTTAGCS
jgi:hypothetical protein